MKPPPVDLSRKEAVVSSSASVVIGVGELLLRVVGNTTGVWWPAISLGGRSRLFAFAFAVYLARTRKRTVWSLLVLVVPDRLWQRAHRNEQR
jgi:hypothetical protein